MESLKALSMQDYLPANWLKCVCYQYINVEHISILSAQRSITVSWNKIYIFHQQLPKWACKPAKSCHNVYEHR